MVTPAQAILNKAISERDFQEQVMQLAKLYQWLCYHVFDSRLVSSCGYPDLTLTKHSRILFCELKKETGRIHPDQHTWLNALRECQGVEVYVWRPSDFNDIVAVLSR